jgi:hypothetical protein
VDTCTAFHDCSFITKIVDTAIKIRAIAMRMRLSLGRLQYIPEQFGGLFNIALSILKMGPVLFDCMEDLISYLQRKGLLATIKPCPN